MKTDSLHVPYTFYPDPCGGTEVYVLGLAQGLATRGHRVAVAAPGAMAARYRHAGLDVHRFAVDKGGGMAAAYGAPDEVAAHGFCDIVARLRPAVVHLHARTAAVSDLLIDVAQAARARVVVTYHTPAMSCARGTMLLFGREPCDGRLNAARCGACALAARGVPMPVAKGLAGLPGPLLQAVKDAGLAWPLNGLRVPGLIADGHQRLRAMLDKADRVVAVCDWVKAVLLANGVPARKLVLSRQGIGPRTGAQAPRERQRAAAGPLRIAVFGRLDPVKGTGVLLSALRAAPEAPVRLDLYLVLQEAGRAAHLVAHAARNDPRITVHEAVSPESVSRTMRGYDMIAVPSTWLETGPLVVLEAFAAGVPVLGSNLGGIAELVRDGVDGILLPPGNAAAWAEALSHLCGNRSIVEGLARNVTRGRTMDDVVDDMVGLYALLAPHAGGGGSTMPHANALAGAPCAGRGCR